MINRLLPIFVIFLFNNIWAEESTSKDCFRVQDISGFHALDDNRLIIWSPTQSKPFLVTLMNRCPNLTFEQTLVFKSTLSRTTINPKGRRTAWACTLYRSLSPKQIKRTDTTTATEAEATLKGRR